MKYTEQEIKDVVDEFVTRKLDSMGWRPFGYNDEVVDHIKNMCVSILQTKYGVGYPGGGFVQAVVNNDLMGTFGRADHINKDFIWLYAELLYNY
jgi:hypothetical protein